MRQARFFLPQCRGCGRSGHNVRTCPKVKRRRLAELCMRLRAELVSAESALDALPRD